MSSTAAMLASVSAEKVAQFRAQFSDQFKKEIDSGTFDKRDVDEMLDDMRIRSYLYIADDDVKTALKNVKEMFVFRKENKVRDVTFDEIASSVKTGWIFFRNKDTAGNNVLWLPIKRNKKGVNLDERKRLIAFLFEQHYQTYRGEPITVVFDLTDCGLSSADMDLTRFVVNCFQIYFPFLLNNLVAYNMPWILQGVWKIIKGWLSARSQEHVKFVNNDAVEPFISRANRFTHIGSGDDQFAEKHPDGDPIYLQPGELYLGTPRV